MEIPSTSAQGVTSVNTTSQDNTAAQCKSEKATSNSQRFNLLAHGIPPRTRPISISSDESVDTDTDMQPRTTRGAKRNYKFEDSEESNFLETPKMPNPKSKRRSNRQNMSNGLHRKCDKKDHEPEMREDAKAMPRNVIETLQKYTSQDISRNVHGRFLTDNPHFKYNTSHELARFEIKGMPDHQVDVRFCRLSQLGINGLDSEDFIRVLVDDQGTGWIVYYTTGGNYKVWNGQTATENHPGFMKTQKTLASTGPARVSSFAQARRPLPGDTQAPAARVTSVALGPSANHTDVDSNGAALTLNTGQNSNSVQSASITDLSNDAGITQSADGRNHHTPVQGSTPITSTVPLSQASSARVYFRFVRKIEKDGTPSDFTDVEMQHCSTFGDLKIELFNAGVCNWEDAKYAKFRLWARIEGSHVRNFAFRRNDKAEFEKLMNAISEVKQGAIPGQIFIVRVEREQDA